VARFLCTGKSTTRSGMRMLLFFFFLKRLDAACKVKTPQAAIMLNNLLCIGRHAYAVNLLGMKTPTQESPSWDDFMDFCERNAFYSLSAPLGICSHVAAFTLADKGVFFESSQKIGTRHNLLFSALDRFLGTNNNGHALVHEYSSQCKGVSHETQYMNSVNLVGVGAADGITHSAFWITAGGAARTMIFSVSPSCDVNSISAALKVPGKIHGHDHAAVAADNIKIDRPEHSMAQLELSGMPLSFYMRSLIASVVAQQILFS